MSSQPHRWSPRCPPPTGLVRPVRVDPSGVAGPTPGQARGPLWRRTGHGWYVPAWVDRSVPEQRILEESVRLTGGAVTGWASNRMQGATFCDGLARDGSSELPVPLNCGPLHQIRRRPGDDLIRDILNPHEIEWFHGVPCTTNPRATFDAARFAPTLREAVKELDVAAAAELVSLRRMTAYVARALAPTGVQQVRDALLLADENSWSPQETRFRLVWVLDAGLPPPLTNRPLFTRDGTLIGYPDLLDEEAGVAGEYDGEDHRGAIRHSHDVDRESRFRDHDLEVCRVTGPDLRDRDLVVQRIHSAYRRAKRVPASRRSWTLTPPPWWRPRPTLDEVLDARDQARDALDDAS